MDGQAVKAGPLNKRAGKPNERVIIAGKISLEYFVYLDPGYLSPVTIDADEWKDREDECVLYVTGAGENLFR